MIFFTEAAKHTCNQQSTYLGIHDTQDTYRSGNSIVAMTPNVHMLTKNRIM